MTTPRPSGHAGIAFDHIAFGVPDAARVGPLLVGVLGGRPHHAGPGSGYRFWQWEFSGGGRLEVLRPEGPPGGFLQRFLDARGPGLHHVTFKVPALAAAADRARGLGLEVVGYDDRHPHWKEAFLHPKSAGGIVVQLAEDHPELYGGASARMPFPPAGDPATPASIVGLRLRAHGEELAFRIWQSLLGGDCRARGDTLHFHWKGSPMRIAVELDAEAAEGPLAVEVRSDATLTLPPDEDPVLGARFVQVPE